METAESRLEETFFVVEATSFEVFCLWSNFGHTSKRRMKEDYSFKWEQMDGWAVQIGKLSKRPVVLDIRWVKIDGHLVAFWHICSQVADYVMAEKWLKEHFRKGHNFKTDANNFHHCLHTIRERLDGTQRS